MGGRPRDPRRVSQYDEDDPAGETMIDREPTSLEPIAPSAFGAAPHARTPPRPPLPAQPPTRHAAALAPPPPSAPPAPQPPGPASKFAAPPPSEVGRFVQPIHTTNPVDPRPVTYFDAPVTRPPRSMVMALGLMMMLSLLQALTSSPSMLVLPGCAPAQIVFAALVAVTCWRGRTYGRPLAVLGFACWLFAAGLALRGHNNAVTLLSYESWQRGEMSSAIRIVIVVRAALEAALLWTLFRPDANKYFAHRLSVDKLGGRKWE